MALSFNHTPITHVTSLGPCSPPFIHGRIRMSMKIADDIFTIVPAITIPRRHRYVGSLPTRPSFHSVGSIRFPDNITAFFMTVDGVTCLKVSPSLPHTPLNIGITERIVGRRLGRARFLLGGQASPFVRIIGCLDLAG